ncbi:MAG: hypothetical protein E7430_02775 [Ruminococcaceae bacterium]|nr:hypothetical protein [Oscillospiraceae bacterium]
MRKTFVLTLCFAVLSVVCICLAYGEFVPKHDEVVITQNVLYGDPTEAEGVTVELSTHYNYHLFWDTEYVVGKEPKTETEYDFSAKEKYSHGDFEYRGIQVFSNFEFGMNLNNPDPRGIEKAYHELFEQAEPGQELEKEIYLADYCEYYPLRMEIDLENCPLHWVHNVYERDDVSIGPQILHYDGRNTGYFEVFEDYFRIPVLDEETLQIHVRKGINGGINGSGGGWGSGDSDRFDMYSLTAIGNDNCFFVFDAHSFEGKVMDMSLLPDGYGIFAIPYFINEEGTTDIDPYSLDMIYELDPEHWISNFFITDDKSKLLLFTVENGMLMLTVVDAQSYEKLQKTEICAVEDYNHIYDYHVHDDFIVISHSDGLLSVISLEDGGYEYQFTVKRGVDVGDTVYPVDYLKITADMDYDHESDKLLIADSMENQTGGWNMTADFYLSVYDETGMTYHGTYTSSLTTGGRSDDYDYFVRNTDAEYISAQFN